MSAFAHDLISRPMHVVVRPLDNPRVDVLLARYRALSGNAVIFFFSSRRRHTRCYRDWSSDVCSSDLKPSYVHLLRHLFRTGKVDFGELPVPGVAGRRAVSRDSRERIRSWREQRLSAGEIAQLLSDQGIEMSVRTVERVLAEEGFPRLPRRTGLKVGLTVKGAKVPEKAQAISLSDLDGQTFESAGAGVF